MEKVFTLEQISELVKQVSVETSLYTEEEAYRVLIEAGCNPILARKVIECSSGMEYVPHGELVVRVDEKSKPVRPRNWKIIKRTVKSLTSLGSLLRDAAYHLVCETCWSRVIATVFEIISLQRGSFNHGLTILGRLLLVVGIPYFVRDTSEDFFEIYIKSIALVCAFLVALMLIGCMFGLYLKWLMYCISYYLIIGMVLPLVVGLFWMAINFVLTGKASEDRG